MYDTASNSAATYIHTVRHQMSCPRCGPFPQKSFHYDHEFHTSPSLKRLSSSNVQATDEEIAHVKTTFLSDIHRDRLSLESRLAALSRIVASMKEECDALRTVENNYQCLVSARRALPHELWSDIFLYARSDEPDDFDCIEPSGVIWRLSHVCKAWRDVALSLDSFWSRLSMSLGDCVYTEQTVQVLQLVLSRSKLLDVNLHCSVHTDPIDLRILDIMLSQSHRWRSAHLEIEAPVFAELYAPIRGRLPQLGSLTLNTCVEEENTVQLFEDCPLLTKVALSSGAVSIPGAQIRELQIGIGEYISWYEGMTRASLDLISQCPILEILRITINVDEDVQAPIITTPNVYRFQTNSGPVMDKLVIPLLREAILSDPLEPTVSHVLQSFKHLLCRSNCMRTLTSLKIVGLLLRRHHTISSCPLLSILVETTRLAILELDLSRDGFKDHGVWETRHVAELMRALQVTDNEVVLPCLSSLTIDMAHRGDDLGKMPLLAPDGSDGSWGNFVGMLKARWAGFESLGLTRLRTFHVGATHVLRKNSQWEEAKTRCSASGGGALLSREEIAILDGLVEDGMDLNIRFTLRDISDIRHIRRLQLLRVPNNSHP